MSVVKLTMNKGIAQIDVIEEEELPSFASQTVASFIYQHSLRFWFDRIIENRYQMDEESVQRLKYALFYAPFPTVTELYTNMLIPKDEFSSGRQRGNMGSVLFNPHKVSRTHWIGWLVGLHEGGNVPYHPNYMRAMLTWYQNVHAPFQGADSIVLNRLLH